MCGIAGVIDLHAADENPRAIVRMAQKMRRRGPDDEGYLLGSPAHEEWLACAGADTDGAIRLPRVEAQAGKAYPVCLGFRRLSILDPSPSGHQPMATPDGNCWILLNGEIYNFIELRAELAKEGCAFRSTSDTEAALAGYTRWGLDVFKRMVGMFAIAIVDVAAKKLILARDFFGVKPLYFTHDESRLAFASEIKAICELPWVQRRANPERLYQYLAYAKSDYGGETFFSDIHQVPPGHFLTVDFGSLPNLRVSVTEYWKLAPEPEKYRDISHSEAAGLARQQFLENIRLHLRSDVPVGAALSGGIDSSSIVNAMRRLEGDALDLHAFSYAAPEAAINEERWSGLAAESARALRHLTKPTQDDLQSDIAGLVYDQEEPFTGLSIYAQRCVFRLANENHVKVLLDGQGADECLAGYPHYVSSRMLSLARQGDWLAAWRLWSSSRRFAPGSVREIGLPFAANLLPAGWQRLMRQQVSHDVKPAWLDAGWFARRNVALRPPERPFRRDALRGELERSLFETSLPMLLRYEDKNSMSYSIESRVPFLTPAFVTLALSLPEECLIDAQGTSKSVFRTAMEGILPAPIAARRDKIGFAAPEGGWLRSMRPWVEGVLARGAALVDSPLRWGVIRRQVDQAYAAQSPLPAGLWRWLNLVLWAEAFNVEWPA